MMSNNTKHESQILTDSRAVLKHLGGGTPLDAETYRRIRERAEHITEALREKYGEMNIAVDLIREARDEA